MANRYADKVRCFNWWFQVERLKQERVQRAFAELGVYRGESAKILHMMDPGRLFFLFDTFEGFGAKDLEGETADAATYTTRNFADTSLEKVRKELGDSPNLVFCPGRERYRDVGQPVIIGGSMGTGSWILAGTP